MFMLNCTAHLFNNLRKKWSVPGLLHSTVYLAGRAGMKAGPGGVDPGTGPTVHVTADVEQERAPTWPGWLSTLCLPLERLVWAPHWEPLWQVTMPPGSPNNNQRRTAHFFKLYFVTSLNHKSKMEHKWTSNFCWRLGFAAQLLGLSCVPPPPCGSPLNPGRVNWPTTLSCANQLSEPPSTSRQFNQSVFVIHYLKALPQWARTLVTVKGKKTLPPQLVETSSRTRLSVAQTKGFSSNQVHSNSVFMCTALAEIDRHQNRNLDFRTRASPG